MNPLRLKNESFTVKPLKYHSINEMWSEIKISDRSRFSPRQQSAVGFLSISTTAALTISTTPIARACVDLHADFFFLILWIEWVCWQAQFYRIKYN